MSYPIPAATAARLKLFVCDATTYEPVTGLIYSDVTSAAFRTRTNGVASSSTAITLTSTAAQTAAVATGQWVEFGGGYYGLDVGSGSVPAVGSTIEAVVTISGNQVTAERHYVDATVSSRSTFAAGQQVDFVDAPNATAVAAIKSGLSTLTAQQVWEHGTRTLSSFGTLVADVVAGVWNATTRTLSAFGFGVTVGDIAQAALARFATTDTGETSAATGSVAKISQGSAGADYSDQLDRIEAKTGLITGAGVSVVSPVTQTGSLVRLAFQAFRDGSVVTDLVQAEISAVAYETQTGGVWSGTSGKSVTLIGSAPVADTAAKVLGQLVVLNAAKGIYAVDCPAGAAPVAADETRLVVTLTDGEASGVVYRIEFRTRDYFESQEVRAGGLTIVRMLDLHTAALLGKSSAPSGTTEKFLHLDNSDAFTVTFDTNDYRTAVQIH